MKSCFLGFLLLLVFVFALGCEDGKEREVAAIASGSSAQTLRYLKTANERLSDLYELVELGKCKRGSTICIELMNDISGELNEAIEELDGNEKEMNSIQFAESDF